MFDALMRRAERRRPGLRHVTFVGITGSTGKTMTRRLVTACLETSGRCVSSRLNTHGGMARAVLETQPTDTFVVAETAMSRPGYLDRSLRVVRPRIGVVTNIGVDHWSAFGSSDAIAEEKAKLIAALPPDGVAVLNADDHRVLAMRARSAAPVITYGCAPGAMVCGEALDGAWPDRLSLTARYGTDAVRVHTKLCGVHWASSVLAAIAAAIAAGIPLQAAADAIAGVEPAPGRMSPVTYPDGVTVIRDDWKSSLPTIAPAIEFLKSARAPRKIVVLGTISDYPGSREHRYAMVARAFREVADVLITVGPHATPGLRARRGPSDAVMAFATVAEASRALERLLRPGDLVLLKGSNRADHLMRIALARTGTVECWRNNCRKRITCDACSLLNVPVEPMDGRRFPIEDPGDEERLPVAPVSATRGEHAAAMSPVVVGLGNPGRKYEGTPHNLGRTVVDLLAVKLGARWEDVGGALVATARVGDEMVRLVKVAAPMNRIGAALADLARRLRFGPDHCILVYDDVDLPLGRVRTRLSGSSGGHRGVGSILLAFQNETVRRVKIGVGRPGGRRVKGDFLLTPFDAADLPAVEKASQEAAEQILTLLRSDG
jgi:aminoacyl-tRNA hydrolase